MDSPSRPPLLCSAAARRLQVLYGCSSVSPDTTVQLPGRGHTGTGPRGEGTAALSPPPQPQALLLSMVAIGTRVKVHPLPASPPHQEDAEHAAPYTLPPAHEPWLAVGLQVARQLQVGHGGWVLARSGEGLAPASTASAAWTASSATAGCERAAVAQLLVLYQPANAVAVAAIAAKPSDPTASSTSAPVASGDGLPPTLSPLLAFNLAVPYTVQPLLQPSGSCSKALGSGGAAAAPLLGLELAAPLRVVPLAVAVADLALHASTVLAALTSSATTAAALAAVRQAGSGEPAAPVAGSVQLCKVGVPRAAAMARLGGAGGTAGGGQAEGESSSAPAPASSSTGADGGAAGVADPALALLSEGDAHGGGGGAGDGVDGADGGSGASTVSRDSVALALQRYFRNTERYVSAGDVLAVPLLAATNAGGLAKEARPHQQQGARAGPRRLVYFKVTEVSAAEEAEEQQQGRSQQLSRAPGRLPLLVSPEQTLLALQVGLGCG